MALKLRVSFYMAFIASSLTLLVAVFNSITLTAMLYRTLVSLVLFAVLGYTCGQFAERFFQKKLDQQESKGKNIDIVSNVDHGDKPPIAEFEPLNPDNFENIILTQKEDGGVSANGR